MTKDVVVNK